MNSRLIALGLAGLLGACSSGGATAPAPGSSTAAAGRASGAVTIRYPAVRTLTAAARRSPRFVDPHGASLVFDSAPVNAQPTDPRATTYIAVAPAADGTQTANVSLIAGNSALGVYEYDAGSRLLAVGSMLLGTVAPGSTQTLAITLNMAAAGVAVTTDLANGSNVTPLGADPSNAVDWAAVGGCAAQTGVSYLLPFDAANSYLLLGQNVGVGGIPLTRIVAQSSDGGGTTKIVNDVGGGVRVVFDAAHDGVTATVQAFDPSGVIETTAYLRYTFHVC